MEASLAGFRDFLPLVLFLVFWWIAAKKQKARRPPPAEPNAKQDKAPSMQELLRQVLTGEFGLPQPPARQTSRPVPPPDQQADDGEDFEGRREQRLPRLKAQTSKPQPPAAMPLKTDAGSPAPKMQAVSPARLRVCKSAAVGRMRRADLRRAVIWSEILGPPVSMRE